MRQKSSPTIAPRLLGLLGLILGMASLAEASLAAAESAPVRSDPNLRLAGWASLAHDYRTPGPTSGQFISAQNGVSPPFTGAQPIPGFSALRRLKDGQILGLPDNGFGTKGNSGDYGLGLYRLTAALDAGRTGQPGAVHIKGFIPLTDPQGWLRNGRGLDLTITADLSHYRAGAGAGQDTAIPVDPRFTTNRWLTGYDFDVESLAIAPDGTFWIGEEFGPWLLHFDSAGRLMGEPVPHPSLISPANPLAIADPSRTTLGGSRGFEALSFDTAGRYLYVTTESAPSVPALRAVPNDERVVRIDQFDPVAAAYTGRSFLYRKDGETVGNAVVIGDMVAVGPDQFILIERDSLSGDKAQIKRLYGFDLKRVGPDGVLEKVLVADLLAIPDPDGRGGPLTKAGLFALPFDSVESLEVWDATTLLVGIDTNYPGGDGRVTGRPDDTELVLIRWSGALTFP